MKSNRILIVFWGQSVCKMYEINILIIIIIFQQLENDNSIPMNFYRAYKEVKMFITLFALHFHTREILRLKNLSE